MTYSTTVSIEELKNHLQDPDWAIIDCRFALADPGKGRKAYFQGHIPGAVYAHLNEDLSNPVIPGKTGRHPLPSIEKVVEKFSSWGIDNHVQVAAYDDYPINGANAARLWWLLRWLGHKEIAVLDGGFEQWLKAGLPQTGGEEHRNARTFIPVPNGAMWVDGGEVEKIRTDPAFRLFDSRSEDRFHGQNETIDPVAGHIPGAYSAPYLDNYDKAGFLLPPEQIRQRFTQLLNGVSMDKAVFYCGSGVTAAVNLFAVEYAGMSGARIYPGSWSEWITDPSRPIAK